VSDGVIEHMIFFCGLAQQQRVWQKQNFAQG